MLRSIIDNQARIQTFAQIWSLINMRLLHEVQKSITQAIDFCRY